MSLIFSSAKNLYNYRLNRFPHLIVKNCVTLVKPKEEKRMAYSPYLNHPITDKDLDSGEGERFSYGVASMQGWRDKNEDCHSCILSYSKNLSFFGVYDGHGGPEVSAYTAAEFPKFLQSTHEWHQGNIADALKHGFIKFDELLTRDDVVEEVKAMAKSINRKQKKNGGHELNDAYDDVPPTMVAGTTVCIAITDGSTLYVANAGDSRCVLCRGGSAVELTKDHKPEDRRERRRIKEAGGHISANGRVNYCLNLSRCVGDHMMKQNPELPLEKQAITASPDVRVERLKAEDEFLVLACDGIWDSKNSQDVVDFIRQRLSKGEKLVSICEQLCDSCLSHGPCDGIGGLDNMTVIIVLLNKDNRNGRLPETRV